jgi:hypothetical protein
MSVISDSERLPKLRVGSRGRRAGPFAGLRSRWHETAPLVAPRETWPLALRRARVIGYAVLGIELVVLCWWMALLVRRDAITWDFAFYSQAIYLISHGTLLPFSTLTGTGFLHNSFELITWPLAVLQMVWPHPVTLKILQALAMVGAQGIALAWICDIAAMRATQDRSATAASVGLVGLGVLLLVANPWYVFSLSFDFHPEPFMILFLVAAARDLFRQRRTAWIWALLLCFCSGIGATFLVALGIGAAASGRRRLRLGLGVALLGVAWLVLVAALHGSENNGVYGALITGRDHGSSLTTSSLDVTVKALIRHPGRAWSILWSNHINIWAALSAAGIVGLLWPFALFPGVVMFLETGLTGLGHLFSDPGIQNNIIAGPLITIGTVALCAGLLGNKRYRRAIPALVALLAANAVLWAIVWFPNISPRWLHTSSIAASTLRSLEPRIRPSDEVVVSQGAIGAFANRQWLYPVTSGTIPVHAHRVWIIVTPRVGIEVLTPAQSYADIRRFAELPGSRLVLGEHGVWAYEWNPPGGTKTIPVPRTGDGTLPAWTVGGLAGRVVRTGRKSTWYVASTSKAGYALSNAYWRKGAGNYLASVSLSIARSRNVNVEVWDDSTNTLLARRVLQDTDGRTTVRLPADIRTAPGDHIFAGWGLWSKTPASPRPGDNLEIRVWSPGGAGRVKVYTVSLTARHQQS